MAGAYRYLALEAWLAAGIHERRWACGERLPSIRQLCGVHQVSRATVQHALQRLEAQGLVTARPRSGYFVCSGDSTQQDEFAKATLGEPDAASVSDLLLDIMRQRGAFDLAPGADVEARPAAIAALYRCIGRAQRHSDPAAHFYYDEPAGAVELRAQLQRYYRRRGCVLPSDQICVTAGCQHALALALEASCGPGDIVAVESPGFYGSLQLLEQKGLRVLEIPSSAATGMDLNDLEQALGRWRIRACIVSPAFATPSGALMPVPSRQRLLALAEAHEFAVIEDDIYADTAIGPIPDPLKSLDRSGRVILCSSLSKSLSRDLRIGWISGGRWHSRIEKLKLVNLLAGSHSVQLGVAQFMADGEYVAHLRRRQSQLQLQRDRLVAALETWPGELLFSRPQGGLAVWLQLADRVDTVAAYRRARAVGITLTPGPLFSASDRFRNCLRLSFEQAWGPARLAALEQLPDLLGLR